MPSSPPDRDPRSFRNGGDGQPYASLATVAQVSRVLRSEAVASRPLGELYFSSWVDRFVIPAAIVGAELQLLWSNMAADMLFASTRDFHLNNGIVACADKAQGEAFRAFLGGVGNEPQAWVYCQGDAARQMVRAEHVQPQGLPEGKALMFYPIDGPSRFLWADFEKVFGLTRAETVVVKRIMGGEAADVIAGDLSVSLDTVRTHLRRIYTKVGVNNREQLFSKLCVFRIL